MKRYKQDKLTYREKQAKLREQAIEWQGSFSDNNYSYGEIAEKQAYFEKEGRKYGLIKEFRENGIL